MGTKRLMKERWMSAEYEGKIEVSLQLTSGWELGYFKGLEKDKMGRENYDFNNADCKGNLEISRVGNGNGLLEWAGQQKDAQI